MATARSSRPVSFLAWAAVLLLLASQGPAPAQAASQVSIEPPSFIASVPHVMTLGQSYKLTVIVQNGGTSTATGSVVLTFPQDYFFTVAGVAYYKILPGDIGILNFTLVPTDVTSNAVNVSVLLVPVSGLSSVPTQRVTVTVDSIVRSQLAAAMPVFIGLSAVAVALLGGGFLALRRRRRRPAGARAPPS